MEHYNAHNDCLVYLQRHSVTTNPTSSLHCKLLGVFWDTENQLIPYPCYCFVTILMRCFIWIKCSLSQDTHHKHTPAWKGYWKYTLYHSTKPEDAVKIFPPPKTLNWTCFPSLSRFSVPTYVKIKTTYIFLTLSEWQIECFTLGWSLIQN